MAWRRAPGHSFLHWCVVRSLNGNPTTSAQVRTTISVVHTTPRLTCTLRSRLPAAPVTCPKASLSTSERSAAEVCTESSKTSSHAQS